jgi:hypothetical protein
MQGHMEGSYDYCNGPLVVIYGRISFSSLGLDGLLDAHLSV